MGTSWKCLDQFDEAIKVPNIHKTKAHKHPFTRKRRESAVKEPILKLLIFIDAHNQLKIHEVNIPAKEYFFFLNTK